MRISLFALAFVSTTLVAVGVTRSQDKADARAMVAKGIKALGGEDVLKKHLAVTFNEKGTYYGMGEGQPYTGKYAVQWPDKFRMEIVGVFAIVLDGDKGWMKYGDKTKDLTKEEIVQQQQAHKAGWMASLLPLQDKAFDLATLADAEVDKQPAVVVKAMRKDYPEVKLYFGKKSGMLLKSEFQTFSAEEKKMVNQEVFFQNYKETQGAQIPTHIIIKRDGKVFVDAQTSDYKAHDKLDAKVFAMP